MVDFKNIHSPCERCYIQGHSFSSEDTSCQRCEYNIAIIALKRILKDTDGCRFCQNYSHLGKGHHGCKLNLPMDCSADHDFIINWDIVFKDYKN